MNVRGSKKLVILCGALLLMSCSNAKLYKGAFSEGSAQMNFCTTAPNAVTTKLKYLFVIDQSANNQQNSLLLTAPTDAPTPDGNGGTDPTGNIRYQALMNFLNTAPASATTFYSSLFFNTNPIVPFGSNYTGGGYNEDTLLQSIWYMLGPVGDITTTPAYLAGQYQNIACPTGPCGVQPQGDAGSADYGDTLGVVLNSIEQDIGYEQSLVAAGGPLTASSYVIFWISSGYPFFQYGSQTQAQINVLEGNITNTVTSIMGLKSQHQYAQYIDSIIINAGFYTTNSSSWSQSETAKVLENMASVGQGSFVDFATNNINFSKFTVPQADVPFTLKDVWIHDASAVWWDGKLMLDSDNDGIPDEIELQWGSNPYAYDSDQNGLGDGVEYFLFGSPCGSIPSGQLGQTGQKCTTAGAITSFRGVPGCSTPGTYPNIYPDTDLDNLNDCEEGMIGTSRTDFDSNQDWVPDQLEWLFSIPYLYGTNGLSADPTNDGVVNYQKLKDLFPINIPISQVNVAPLSYEITQSSSTSTQTCYNVNAQEIATMSPTDTIRVYIMETNGRERHMRVLKNVTHMSNSFVNINDGDLTP